MLWMKKVNKKIYNWYLMLEILRSLFWNDFVKKCWSTVNLICKSFLQLTLGLQGSFLVRWWQLHCVDPQCTWWVSPSKPFVEIVIIILLNGKSSLFLFGSLRSKRFQSSYCAKVRAEAKKRLKGEGRRGNACPQTPRFWKTPLDISWFGSFVNWQLVKIET